MANVKWTAAQSLAIGSRGNILVSAAAGSGKTATLSAKIMHLLREDPDVSIDDFLIVTFTNAAAAELRQRIGREISEAAKSDRTMLRHKKNLASADICTIHSFCLKLLRRYFTTLGISPDFAVADETASDVMKSRAMETAVDDFFRGDAKIKTAGACDIFTLADCIGKTKDAAGLDASLRDLHRKLTSVGLGEKYLRECADLFDGCAKTDFLATPHGGVIAEEMSSAAEHYLRVLTELKSEMAESEVVVTKYMPAADALTDYLTRILRNRDAYDRLSDAVSTYESVRLGTLTAKNKTDASEKFKAVRDEVKETFTLLANKYFSSGQDDISAAYEGTAAVLRGAADVLEEYVSRYTALKRERGVLDFSDLEELALKLLVDENGKPTPEAKEAGSRYKFVFIDEYQDTNSVQDSIFRAVSTDAEKFFVGDIKQSIYRFRGAEPEVFSGYRREWSEDMSDETVSETHGAGHSIFMSENFRCARPVIEFVNSVSRYMFPHGGIPFTESDCLVYGGVAAGDVPVEVCLLDGSRRSGDGDEDIPVITEEEYTAGRIFDLIKNEGAAPGEIAILLRNANKTGSAYEAALKARGIPVRRPGGTSFADESEVTLVLDILRAIDNPMRDISLAGAMMSSVFGFDMDDLTRLRMEDSDRPLYSSVELFAERDTPLGVRCRAFTEKLASLRRAQRGMPADRFIEHLYAECGLMDCREVTSKLAGEKNLHTLHELARSYEAGVFGGLYGFLSFIDEKLESGTLTTEGKSDADGVTVISIHKSKGLEYKYCFLCACGKERSDLDEKGNLLFDRDLGIGLRLSDPGGLILCGNPIRDAVALKLRRESAMEEMRVLYVAMTRAKERLFVTGKCRTTPEKELSQAAFNACYRDGYLVRSQNRMLDLILQAAVTDENLSFTLTYVPKYAEENASVIGTDKESVTVPDVTDEELQRVRGSIAFSYPSTHLANIPSKIAVSALFPRVLDDEEVLPATLQGAAVDEEFADEKNLTENGADAMPRPKFMTGGVDTSPADRGTSTHVFLQFASFAALRSGRVRDELARLTEKGFITEKMAKMVNRAQVERFAAGGIMERILSARRVEREFRFNVRLPAAAFTSDPELKEKLRLTGERITVQGVFDCVFEDGDGRLVLLDYKTDYITPEEMAECRLAREKLRSRHSLQLTYYAEAVRLIFGRYPDEVYVYSLPLGECVAIPLDTGILE